jgi:hypothetical protein
MIPAVHLIQDWPFDMDESLSASFLAVSQPQFRKLVGLYGSDYLRPHNLLPGGDNRWTRHQLEKFVNWRASVGREEKQRSA